MKMTKSDGYHTVIPMTEFELEILFKDVVQDGQGHIEWTSQKDDTFLITGYLHHSSGEKFKPMSFATWEEAKSISIHKGKIYLVRQGHKKLLKEITP